MAKIVNLGSTCYISSSLQLLFSIDSFREQLLVAATVTKLGLEIKRLFKQMSERKTVSVRAFAHLLKISDKQCRLNHEDIQEFLLELVNKLRQDTAVNNIIDSVFNGVLQTNSSSSPMEPFFGTSFVQMTCN